MEQEIKRLITQSEKEQNLELKGCLTVILGSMHNGSLFNLFMHMCEFAETEIQNIRDVKAQEN